MLERIKNIKIDLGVVIMVCVISTIIVTSSISFLLVNNSIKSLDKNSANSSERNYSKHFVLLHDNNSEVWDTIYKYANMYANENNVFVEMPGENFGEEYNKHQLFEMSVLAGVDGIIVEGDGSSELHNLISSATEKSIPVITVMTDMSDSKRNSFIGVGSYDVGKELANQILKEIREGQDINNIMILLSQEDAKSAQHTMYLAIMEKLSGVFEGKIDVRPVDNSTPFSTDEIIRDIMLNMNEEPDIMVCLSDEILSSANQALVEYNKVGNIEIMGFASSKGNFEAVDKGIVKCVMSYDKSVMGRNCVEALLEYIDMGYVSEYLMVDTTFINKDNVREYIDNEEKR